jgi:AraC family transcriptional regulator
MVKHAGGGGTDASEASDGAVADHDEDAVRSARLARSILPAPTLVSRQWPHAVARLCRDPAHVQGFLEPASNVHHVVMAMSAGFRVESRELGSARWRSSEVAPGELVIAGAGAAPTELCWRSHGPGRTIDLLELYLDPSALSAADDASARLQLEPHWTHVRDPLLSHLLAELAKGLRNPDSAELAFGELATLLFARQLQRSHGAAGAPPGPRHGGLAPFCLARVREYVAAHLSGSLRLGQLAAVAGLSPFHFSRAFKLTTGLSPHAYVTRCRIEEAKRLLITSTLPISEIARRAGFRGSGQLSTRFRAATGRAPSAYRRFSRP